MDKDKILKKAKEKVERFVLSDEYFEEGFDVRKLGLDDLREEEVNTFKLYAVAYYLNLNK